MNAFEQELVKRVRELPDEVWVQLIGDHIDQVLTKSEGPPMVIQKRRRVKKRQFKPEPRHTAKKSAPKRKKRHISYTRLIVQGQRLVMWQNRRGWFIQDEKSRRGKTAPVTKVVGRTETEAKKRLRKALD